MRKNGLGSFTVVLLMVLALFAASCGNDSSDGGDAAPSDDETSTDDTTDDDGGGADAVTTDDDTTDDDTTDDDTTDDDTTDDDTTDDGADDSVDMTEDGGGEAACDATVPGTQVDYAPFVPTASFNPPYSSGTLVGGTELAAVYDVLMTYDVETGEYHPHLAESLEPNDDFTVWTLTLRDGIAYDDGTPLDAEMVLANIDAFLEPLAGQNVINTTASFLQLIDSSVTVDDLTIEFTLTKPWSGFPYVFNREAGMIVNQNAIGDDPVAFGSNPPPEAGVGPYRLTTNTPGEEIVLEARDDYWGGPVCLETIRMVVAASGAITGFEASYEAFQNGDVDVAFLRDSAVIAEARANGEKELFDYQDAGIALVFNLREGSPMNDPVLREAVSLAIDADIIDERAYDGAVEPVGKAFILDDSPFYSDAIETIDTDAARAAELVAESGFTGTVRVLCQTAPSAIETGLAVEGMLENAGLDVAVENIPTLDAIARMATGDFDIGCWGINSAGDTSVPAYYRNLFSDSVSNRQGYQDADMDQLLDAAMAAPLDELDAALAAVNNKYVSEFLGVPIGPLEEGIVLAPDVEGVVQTGSTIFLFHDAYIAQ